MSRTTHHTRIYRTNSANPIFYNWISKEPKEWRRIYKHRKRRAEWKSIRERIMQGADLDNMVYPLDTRPWIYYW